MSKQSEPILDEQLIAQLQRLLKATQDIATHQEEISRLRGERFNIFSILKMESKENATHSAFLGALLDPKGTHGMGSVFLELFLKAVGYVGEFVAEGARVQLEFTIGPRDVETKTGGRIDIYLEDRHHTAISIENKIYAYDQPAQVERYYNHKKGRNTVYYLTLWGEPASADSKGDLKEKDHYHCISYRDTIVEWLAQCLKEAADQPILRETIKQYMILIQKLTGQLTEHKMREELYNAIGRDYRAAKLVANHIQDAEDHAVRNFLNLVKEKIEAQLKPKEDWIVGIHENLRKNSGKGLYIYHRSWQKITLHIDLRRQVFGGELCHFSIVLGKDAFDKIGIVDGLATPLPMEGKYKDSDWYSRYREVDLFQSQGHIERLFKNEVNDIAAWTDEIAKEFVELSLMCKDAIPAV